MAPKVITRRVNKKKEKTQEYEESGMGESSKTPTKEKRKGKKKQPDDQPEEHVVESGGEDLTKRHSSRPKKQSNRYQAADYITPTRPRYVKLFLQI
jgi:hypothetical protein